MPFNSVTGRLAGQASKRGKNRLSNMLRNKLNILLDDSLESINVAELTNREKIDFVKSTLPYILAKYKFEDEQNSNSQKRFNVRIIDDSNNT